MHFIYFLLMQTFILRKYENRFLYVMPLPFQKGRMNIELSKHFHDRKNNVSLMEGYVEDLKNKKELYINKS